MSARVGGRMRGAMLAWPRVAILAALLSAATDSSAQPAVKKPPARPAVKPAVRPVPKPAVTPAEPAADAPGTTEFTVGGLRVVLRRNPASDVVVANLYLLGGTRLVPAAKAGLEAFYLLASEQGTTRYPKAALREAMARLGTAIAVDAEHDWTMFGLAATSGTLDSTWAVFADRLLHPRLEPAELERVREQALTAVRQRRDDPDTWLEFLADSVAFAGHPYGIVPTGTETSLAGITREDLEGYRKTKLVTSRMRLVVVGNVGRAQVERLVRGTFGRLPAGDYQWSLPEPTPRGRPALAMDGRSLPTNYLLGYFGGPRADSPDYQALRLACAVLSGQLFSEIRGRQNLTYAVSAPFKERAYASAGLYVSTVLPDSVLAVMKRQLELLQAEVITPEGLAQLVNSFLTDHYLDNETTIKQADALARALLFRGDWRAADRLPEELRRLTPQDLRRAAQTYLKGLRLAYVGDPRRLTRSRVTGF